MGPHQGRVLNLGRANGRYGNIGKYMWVLLAVVPKPGLRSNAKGRNIQACGTVGALEGLMEKGRELRGSVRTPAENEGARRHHLVKVTGGLWVLRVETFGYNCCRTVCRERKHGTGSRTRKNCLVKQKPSEIMRARMGPAQIGNMRNCMK